jgi:membrane fusion protein, adhesin transport system
MKENTVMFTPKGSAGIPRARARFLAQAIQLEESGTSSIIKTSIFFTVFMLVAAIYWAWVTEVSEVTVSRGEVVPAGLIHDIQHLEGGIVNKIHVRDGDRVELGDTLLQFAPPASQSEFAQTQVRLGSLTLEGERLQAIIEQRKPAFGESGEKYPVLAQKQMTIYQAQLGSHKSALDVADAQIRQRQTELLRQENRAKSIVKEIALLKEQVEIREELFKDKMVSRTELLSTQTRVAEAESERSTIQDDVIVARSALEEARTRRLEIDAEFRKKIEVEAGSVASKTAETEQAMIRLQDRVNRLDIKAPVAGIIQGLSITRINAVVEPGQVIMQIVPLDDEMMVETRIPPAEIGHIHKGLPADVKVDSFDSARFGSVAGTLRQISAYTYLDEKGQPYYKAEIELQQDFLGRPDQQLKVIPGMTVQADIKTGSKTILDYMLRPISRGFGSAFHER